MPSACVAFGLVNTTSDPFTSLVEQGNWVRQKMKSSKLEKSKSRVCQATTLSSLPFHSWGWSFTPLKAHLLIDSACGFLRPGSKYSSCPESLSTRAPSCHVFWLFCTDFVAYKLYLQVCKCSMIALDCCG